MAAALRLRRVLRVLTLGVVCAAFAPRASAQCGTQDTGTFNLVSVTPVMVSFVNLGVTDFDRGWSTTLSYTVTVNPSKGKRWDLCVQAAAMAFPPVSGYAKPIGDLQWSPDGTNWNAFSTAVQTASRNNSGTQSIVVYVRLVVRYAADVPGTYGPVTLNFIASY